MLDCVVFLSQIYFPLQNLSGKLHDDQEFPVLEREVEMEKPVEVCEKNSINIKIHSFTGRENDNGGRNR
jgi:hypothetical protein